VTGTGPVEYWLRCGSDEGQFQVDGNLVADQHAAGFEDGVPGQAEVLAADRGFGAEAGAGVAEGIDGHAVEFGLEGHGAGDALDGEVALQLVGVALGDDGVGYK